MRGYERDEDDYYDDYEDEDERQMDGEEEEEYEEMEERKPTAEELEYLTLRQRLKEQIRKKRLKESGLSLAKSQEKKTSLSSEKFGGSFFGPSLPVISQRVIQESKSLLENPHLVMKMATSNSGSKKSSASTAAGSRNGESQQIPKYKKEMQDKAKSLRELRNYDFLGNDANFPAPAKESAPRNVNAPRSEARSAPMAQKSKQLPSINGRSIQGRHEERRSHSLNGHMGPKSGQQKSVSASKPNSASIDSRRQLGSNNGVGPGRPVGPKGLPAKSPVATLDKKVSASGSKSTLPPSRKPLPSKMQPSVSKKPVQQRPLQQRPSEQRALEQRTRAQEPNGVKMVPKKVQVPLKPQINRSVKSVPSHGSLHDNQPKKRPMRPGTYHDEDEKALSIIRQMFGARRRQAHYDDDDDDSDMEANFEDIMREERRSEKIARQEDEEQLRLIEEEERRARMRKKRKLAQA